MSKYPQAANACFSDVTMWARARCAEYGAKACKTQEFFDNYLGFCAYRGIESRDIRGFGRSLGKLKFRFVKHYKGNWYRFPDQEQLENVKVRQLGFAYAGDKIVFMCRKCGASEKFNAPRPINPEACAHRARHRGWDAYAFDDPRTLCPACAMAKKPAHDPDSELRKLMENPAKLLPAPVAAPEPAPASSPDTATTVVEPQRNPTSEQRLNIRSMLDKHFDDSVGRYLDGYSDQRVAEDLQVPRCFVERIREAAYGPIRGNPELDALRVELEKLKAWVADLRSSQQQFSMDIGAAMGSLVVLEDRLRKAEG